MRDSQTKRRVTEPELAALVRRAFGPDASAAGWRELEGGSYNAVYAVSLSDGRDLILTRRTSI